MKFIIIIVLVSLSSLTAFSQKVTVVSPNQKINIGLYNTTGAETGEWYLKVSYLNKGKICEAIPKIALGIFRSDQNFSKELKYLNTGKTILVNEQYSALHGKRSQCSNSANETIEGFLMFIQMHGL